MPVYNLFVLFFPSQRRRMLSICSPGMEVEELYLLWWRESNVQKEILLWLCACSDSSLNVPAQLSPAPLPTGASPPASLLLRAPNWSIESSSRGVKGSFLRIFLTNYFLEKSHPFFAIRPVKDVLNAWNLKCMKITESFPWPRWIYKMP